MICIFLLFIHTLCVAFGYDGFIKDLYIMSITPVLELLVIDTPIIAFIAWKRS